MLGHGLPGEVLETEENTDEVLADFGEVPVVGFTEDRGRVHHESGGKGKVWI